MKKMWKATAWILSAVLALSVFGMQTPVSAENGSSDGQSDLLTTNNSKKGYCNGTYIEGSGVRYIFDNMELTDYISSSDCGCGGTSDGNGHNYYFKYNKESLISRYAYSVPDGASVITQVMMPWTDDPVLQTLINPLARKGGYAYYALNASDEGAKNALKDIFSYLIGGMPQVSYWVVGNEINRENFYNYCGDQDVNTTALIAAQSFECVYDTIDKLGSSAKAAICLDMCWNPANLETGGYLTTYWFKSKNLLTAFGNIEAASGRNWYLAFHPYPVPAADGDDPANWCLWSQKCAPHQTFDENTPFITGANLYILTDYIRSHWGDSHHVLLTEFGYDFHQGETAQAAQLYYTYKAAERNSMVDAIIYQWYQSADAGDGRDMGMLNADCSPREIYNVFMNMDRDSNAANESRYMSYLGSVTGTSFTNWQQNISYGFAGTMQPNDPGSAAVPVPSNYPITPTPDTETTGAVYRLYNIHGGEHFYTTSLAEVKADVTAGWYYDGIAWISPTESSTPVYRLYNPDPALTEHFYTTDIKERDHLVSEGWNAEGISWYSDDNQTVPVYRDRNPNALTRAHLFTTSLGEHNNLVSLGWVFESIAWYASAAAPAS